MEDADPALSLSPLLLMDNAGGSQCRSVIGRPCERSKLLSSRYSGDGTSEEPSDGEEDREDRNEEEEEEDDEGTAEPEAVIVGGED